MESEIKDGLLSDYLRRARLGRIARNVRGKHILDIGCDQGYLIPFLPKDIEYTGIDIDQAMLEKAIKNYPQYQFQQLALSVKTIDQIAQQNYDSITLAAILEHLDNPIDILKQLRNLLNPHGRIIITTPHAKSHRLLVLMAKCGLARNDKHEHEHYIDHNMLLEVIRNNMFNLIKYKRFQFGLNQLWVLEKTNE